MATHPDARCGQCPGCQHVEATKRIVLAHSAPAGPGLTQREADLWNDTLELTLCEHPLIFVTHDRHTVEGRVIAGELNSEPDTMITVMTLRYDIINVPNKQCREWSPNKLFETLNYVTIATNLQNMPATWYPGLLEALIKGAQKAKTFTKNGASTIVKRLEDGPPTVATDLDGK